MLNDERPNTFPLSSEKDKNIQCHHFCLIQWKLYPVQQDKKKKFKAFSLKK